ncbi:MAG: LysM peptidoglycan-binding domain-containing protein [Thermodesulfovibrionales bacterium]
MRVKDKSQSERSDGQKGGTMRIIIPAFILFIMIFSGNAHGEEFYKVKKGDSLYKIAKKFHVSVDTLKEINNIDDERLKPGMKLVLVKDKAVKERKGESKTHETTKVQKTESVSYNPGDSEFHIVKKGDTLAGIARKYGVSLSEIREINDLKSKRLKIGQKILLKRTGPRTYTVKKGDNIWKIAKKFNIDAEEIMELNELDSDELRPGQKLILEAWIDEKELKRYETAISELKTLEEVKAASDSDITRLGIKDRVVLFAKKMLNIPYRFGGSSFMGIDCSGYVQKVFGFLNVSLPRSAREQFKVGEPVSKEELNIGDLVFFRTYASFPSHVGIYLGNNLFIHASSKSKKVTIDSLDTPYYLKRFIGAKRIISDEGSSHEISVSD